VELVGTHERTIEPGESAGTAPATRAQRIRVAGVRRFRDLPRGTAKQISEISDVPALASTTRSGCSKRKDSSRYNTRTHSSSARSRSPRRSRPCGTSTTRASNPSGGALRGIEPLADDNGPEATHEVWSLSGESAIQSRTQGLIEEADRELILVIGHAPVFTDGLRDRLKAACRRRGVTLIVGVVSEALQTRVEEELPEAEVSVSGLDWLQGTSLTDDDTEISRLLLIDRNTILISTFHGTTDGGKQHEQAVFGRGFDNGLCDDHNDRKAETRDFRRGRKPTTWTQTTLDGWPTPHANPN